jgi:2,4-dienoyl-CoA reductase-like NADH-dependent reductase (Old Yellow Enzyme family)
MKTLFDETEINGMKLKNRFVRSATWERMADKKGHLTEKLYDLYKGLSLGGTGLIISSVTYIIEDVQPLEGMIGFYNDSFIQEHKRLTEDVHKNCSKIILQANYASRKGSMIGPEDVSEYEINNIIEVFANAGLRAKQSGYDGIQIHAAHGFFLSRFLTDNKRIDGYGGNMEKNSRIILEIYEAVRKKTGDDFNVMIKLNGTDSGGDNITFDSCKFVSKKLSDLGINGIEISGSIDNHIKRYNESVFREYAEAVAGRNNVPIILVGLNRSFGVMNEILNNTNIGYFSLSRPLICEPDLIEKWQKNSGISPKCISCNKCFSSNLKNCIFH